MKIIKKVQNILLEITKYRKNSLAVFLSFNLLLNAISFIYIKLRFVYLNDSIPFWYTKQWGSYILTPRQHIYIIPLLILLLTLASSLAIYLSAKFYVLYIQQIISYFVTFANILLFYQIVRIIHISSIPFKPFVNPLYLGLVIPFGVSFLITFLIIPFCIKFLEKKGIVTNPQVHTHPAMILKDVSARGGGVIFGLIVLLLSIFILGVPKYFVGIYIGLVMLCILGATDDYQNAFPKSSARIIESPFFRFFLLFCAVSPLVFTGVRFDFMRIPFFGAINLTGIMAFAVPVVSSVLTLIWVVFILNILSWSNGVDGQYPGIVGISSVVIAILALRFSPLQEVHKNVATLAAISAGSSFAFIKYNWFPSKIMWGFGAVTAGLLLSSLSILSQTKITLSVLIILIPFLDGVITMMRRIIQKKNPLKGDRGHLHHLLLNRGWGVSKIAVFYWGATAVFGFIALVLSEKYSYQTLLFLVGLVASGIVLLNILSLKNNQ